MFNKKYVKYQMVLAISLSSIAFDVVAGAPPASGSLHYAPDILTTSIPTLGNMMLIILSLLLLVVGLRSSKKKGVSKLFSLLAGVLCLIPVFNSGKLINNAMAVFEERNISNASGGVVSIPDAVVSTTYKNTSGVKQKITQIDNPTNRGACEVNVAISSCKANITSLSNGETCTIQCDAPTGD